MNKMITILFAISYLLFSFSLNMDDYNLPSFITFNRIGLILLLLIIILISKRKIELKINIWSLLLLLTLAFIICWGLLSALFSDFPFLVDMTPVILWVLTLYVVLCTNIIIEHLNSEIFVTFLIYSTFIIITFLYLSLISSFGFDFFGLNSYRLRHFINDIASIGLNRFISSLVFISVFSISVLFNIINIKTKSIRVLSLINFLGVFYLVLLSGSRQSFIGIVMFILLSLILNKSFSLKKLKFRNLLGILLIFTVVFLLIYDNSWFQQRFIEVTNDQLHSSNYSRLNIYMDFLGMANKNPVFGLGPDVFTSFSAAWTHNGYINLAVNFGYIPLFVLLLFFILITIKMIFIKNKDGYIITSVSFTLIFIFVLVNFNDILNVYVLWINIAFILRYCQNQNKKT